MGMGMSPSKRNVGTMQRLVRQLYLEIDGVTPVINEGSLDASLADLGPGIYRITFNEAFLRAPICMGSGLEAETIVTFDNVSTSSVDVIVEDAAGAAKDATVHVMITGFDTTDAI